MNKSVGIAMSLFWGISLLIPQSSYAQSNNCQITINSVTNELKAKGVRTVTFSKGNANERNFGNPTKRMESLDFLLSPWLENYADINSNSPARRRSSQAIDNIMNSLVLLNSYADKIVSNCNNIAVVSFTLAQSDYTHEYAIQSNGKTQGRKCADGEPPKLFWNEMYCY